MRTSTIDVYPAPKKIIPIVPYAVKGRYRNIKTFIMTIAYAVYFGLPWTVWHGHVRTGQPFLFDIENGRFNFFDLVVYPQDLMIFFAIMVTAACFLFIAATFYGRVFCGFFCFQTIWTDAFRMIEQFIQGEAQARIRLSKQPWNIEKFSKLFITHVLWLLFAIATATTFTLYFSDAPKLLIDIFRGHAAIPAYVTVISLTFTTYVAAGIAKEDICRVACPYGKFQSVMQDPMTKTVTYDSIRGEREKGRVAPSKAIKDPTQRASLGYGDCVDCGYCVNVCPTGVDIRKGFQIDCISCGLCIDACDSIMNAVKLPTGLIRFNSLTKQSSVSNEYRFSNHINKIGYFSFLILSVGFIAYQITNLSPYSINIQQQAQPLVTMLADGSYKSRYVIRISNKSNVNEKFQILAIGLPEKVKLDKNVFEVPAGKSYTHTVDMILSEQNAKTLKSFYMVVKPSNTHNRIESIRLNYNFKP